MCMCCAVMNAWRALHQGVNGDKISGNCFVLFFILVEFSTCCICYFKIKKPNMIVLISKKEGKKEKERKQANGKEGGKKEREKEE